MRVASKDTSSAPAARASCGARAAVDETVAPAGAGEVAELSRLGGLMNRLQSLERTDPARYRAAMGFAAARLGAAAEEARGGAAELLGALSRKFEQAGQGGAAPLAGPSVRAAASGPGTRAARYAASDATAAPQLEEIVAAALQDAEG